MSEPTEAEIEAVARAICCPRGCIKPHGEEVGCIAYQCAEVAKGSILAIDRVRGIAEVEVLGRTK